MHHRLAFLLATFSLCVWGQFSNGVWRTDLTKRSVNLAELVSVAKKDGIASLDHPKFVSSAEASSWLDGKEPVIVLDLDGEARAYPLQILIWHLMINDRVGETPILVSYSVFAHDPVVFDRRAGGITHEFGFSGMVRNSNAVLFDRQTESLWQQLTGQAIVGSLTGTRLTSLKSQIAPFDVFRETYPNGKILSRETGYDRHYGQNPYAHYLSSGHPMFPVKLSGALPIPALEVVSIVQGGQFMRAYPFSVLGDRHVIEDKIGERKFVILSSRSMLDILNAPSVADAGKTLAVGIFSPEIDGKALSFGYRTGAFFDKQTRSTWNLLGFSIKGPLAGKRLKAVPNRMAFAFAWLAMYPETVLVSVPGPVVPDPADYPPGQNPDPTTQHGPTTH